MQRLKGSGRALSSTKPTGPVNHGEDDRLTNAAAGEIVIRRDRHKDAEGCRREDDAKFLKPLTKRQREDHPLY